MARRISKALLEAQREQLANRFVDENTRRTLQHIVDATAPVSAHRDGKERRARAGADPAMTPDSESMAILHAAAVEELRLHREAATLRGRASRSKLGQLLRQWQKEAKPLGPSNEPPPPPSSSTRRTLPWPQQGPKRASGMAAPSPKPKPFTPGPEPFVPTQTASPAQPKATIGVLAPFVAQARSVRKTATIPIHPGLVSTNRAMGMFISSVVASTTGPLENDAVTRMVEALFNRKPRPAQAPAEQVVQPAPEQPSAALPTASPPVTTPAAQSPAQAPTQPTKRPPRDPDVFDTSGVYAPKRKTAAQTPAVTIARPETTIPQPHRSQAAPAPPPPSTAPLAPIAAKPIIAPVAAHEPLTVQTGRQVDPIPPVSRLAPAPSLPAARPAGTIAPPPPMAKPDAPTVVATAPATPRLAAPPEQPMSEAARRGKVPEYQPRPNQLNLGIGAGTRRPTAEEIAAKKASAIARSIENTTPVAIPRDVSIQDDTDAAERALAKKKGRRRAIITRTIRWER